MNSQSITLGGGCFWCLEAVYEQVDGVLAVESGYCNGDVVDPSYAQVCDGDSGHAEVVRVEFDAERIGLREILQIFFAIHDPTTPDRQGNDIGPQYRSGIYWHEASQEALALALRAEVDTIYRGQVVTEVLACDNYWRAEAEHQHYYARHPNQGYCAAVIAPKMAKFRHIFKSRLRAV
ncbi:MAG: peptide-methionine (S)-S-oxide reductase MsrA [Rubrivivax sp.]|nr:peptide-methionine (S)-S-oxide reductase MsrA [Rubrivivax sp.]MDP3085444.1 peptide-methionine (S)-S-oxide reductase MsrA [Rubrivivax sp.]